MWPSKIEKLNFRRLTTQCPRKTKKNKFLATASRIIVIVFQYSDGDYVNLGQTNTFISTCKWLTFLNSCHPFSRFVTLEPVRLLLNLIHIDASWPLKAMSVVIYLSMGRTFQFNRVLNLHPVSM